MNFVGLQEEIKSLIIKGYDSFEFYPELGRIYYKGKKLSKYRNLSLIMKEIGLFYISNSWYQYYWPNSKAYHCRKLRPEIKEKLIKILNVCLN
jgi:hypothetical protein